MTERKSKMWEFGTTKVKGMNDVSVYWHIHDGYDANPQQESIIKGSELKLCKTEDDVRKLIGKTIDADFKARISPDISDTYFHKVIRHWKVFKQTTKGKQ